MRRTDRGLVTIDTGTPVIIDPPAHDPRDDHPQRILKLGTELTTEEYERLRDLWNKRHDSRTLYLDPRWEWIDVTPFSKPPGTEYVHGMCSHLEVIPVDSIVTGETVAHLCLTCDTQLPE